jgi:hypothetical protein
MNAISGKLTRVVCRRVLLVCLLPLIAAGCSPNGPPIGQEIPPVSEAGADQTVTADASVTLDGSGSSGGSLSFSWNQLSGTPVSLSSTSSPIVTFTAPNNGTALVFELTVSNTKGDSTATVNVSVHPANALAQVNEIRQPSVKNDLAVIGDFPDTWTLAPTIVGPPQPPGETGAATGIDKIQYARAVEISLTPGASQQSALQVAGPALLLGVVRWMGTTDPLQVKLALAGTDLVTGDAFSIGTDRGGTVVRKQTTAGGQATLSVTNTSAATVNVLIILGAYPL